MFRKGFWGEMLSRFWAGSGSEPSRKQSMHGPYPVSPASRTIWNMQWDLKKTLLNGHLVKVRERERKIVL